MYQGDIKYGAKRTNKAGGINLHSREVEFIHPIKKKLIKLVADTPNEIIWHLYELTIIFKLKKLIWFSRP